MQWSVSRLVSSTVHLRFLEMMDTIWERWYHSIAEIFRQCIGLLGVKSVPTSHCHTTTSNQTPLSLHGGTELPESCSLNFRFFSVHVPVSFVHRLASGTVCPPLQFIELNKDKEFLSRWKWGLWEGERCRLLLLFIIIAYHESSGWFSISLLGSSNYLRQISLIGCCNFCFLFTPTHSPLYSSPLNILCLWTRGCFHSIAYLSCG